MSSETITGGNNNNDPELHEFLVTSLELWGPGNAEYDVFQWQLLFFVLLFRFEKAGDVENVLKDHW